MSFVATSCAALPWAYGMLAIIGTAVYTFRSFEIWKVDKPESRWRTWHSYWVNGAGAALGWLSGWVVIDRWFRCTDCEPSGWTILLAVLAFVGITGHLPMTLMHGISALRGLVARYFSGDS